MFAFEGIARQTIGRNCVLTGTRKIAKPTNRATQKAGVQRNYSLVTTRGARNTNKHKSVVSRKKVTTNHQVSSPLLYPRICTYCTEPEKEEKEKKKTLLRRIVEEAQHYWAGTKALGRNVRVSFSLIWQVLQGRELTRRERKHLVSTTVDIIRVIPFSVFIIIPFMELLLPVALYFFPNMLPSTFTNKLKKEQDLKRHLTARINVARFFQDTVNELQKPKEITELMKAIRTGKGIDLKKVQEYSEIFRHEFTALSPAQQRPLLESMCKFLQLFPYGTNAFLRWQISGKIDSILSDDQVIESEGLEHLTFEELKEACRVRGMRSHAVSKQFLRTQMQDWLEMSLHSKMPVQLMILARALDEEDTEETVPIVKKKQTEEPEKTPEDVQKDQMLVITKAVALLSSIDALRTERKQLQELIAYEKNRMEQREEERLKQEGERKEQERMEKEKEHMEKEMTLEEETEEQLKEEIFGEEKQKEEAEKPQEVEKPTEVDEKTKKNIRILETKLANVVDSLELELERVEKELGDKMNLIDKDHDGIISTSEILELCKDVLKEEPNEEIVKKVISLLDWNKDGSIDLQDVSKIRAQLEAEIKERKEKEEEKAEKKAKEEKKEKQIEGKQKEQSKQKEEEPKKEETKQKETQKEEESKKAETKQIDNAKEVQNEKENIT